jgi:protein SCO1/2
MESPSEHPATETATRFSNGVIFGGIAVLVVVIGILVTGFYSPGWLNRDTAYAFTGGTYEPPNPAAPIELVDQDNQPFTLEQERGKVAIFYFGYTYCPDYCPTTLVDMQKMKDALGDKAGQVDVIMITVDPERDTPARLKEYLEFFDPAFIGLSGTQEQINQLKMPYGIFLEKQTPDATGQYLVDHSTQLYAIDPEGNLRLTWPYGTAPEDIAEDIEHILPE